EPGDVIVTNDPWASKGLATHLPDLHMIRPYYYKGRVVAYGWSFIHFTDVGGRVPSSISPANNEIFQEGIQVPPMKIVDKGEINHDFVTLFRANVRTPDQNMGDIKAILGSLETGSRRVADMIERHGVETFLAAQTELQDYSAAKARAVLRRIPDGTYEFWDYMDDDMLTIHPVRVRVKLTVRDGLVHMDLTGTDPTVKGAYNVPTAGTVHYWLTMRLTTFICSHDRTIHLNAGLYRPMSVTNPPGTILNAEFPDAVGVRSAPARRLQDAVTGLLVRAVPDMMGAPTCGASTPFALAEYEADGARRTVQVVEPMRGGMGAWNGGDGVDVRDSSMANLQNHPVETVEQEAGVIIREYDVNPDSAGPGRWRGGAGQIITVEITRDGSSFLARGMDRLRFPAFGVMGAKPAKLFRAVLNRGRPDERQLTKIDTLAVKKGDILTLLMPGGGGYGDPYLRPAESVRRDVEMGFVSRAGARDDYGVVIGPDGRLDEDATKRLRAEQVRDNIHADFDFGPEREAWEDVFDDETMCEMVAGLMRLPKSVRAEKRTWIFDQAVPGLERAGKGWIADAIPDADAARARLKAAMEAAFGAARAEETS
ncbi:MAG: hydantoinase B/oxoprolinase family protein, partial [Rhodospirillales bacterium]|nr:hydantoinase B/oxoprolinase family protein [Rhodospirillales bacterium]